MPQISYYNKEISSDFQHTVTIIVPNPLIKRFSTWKSLRTNGITTTMFKEFPALSLAQEFGEKTNLIYSIDPS